MNALEIERGLVGVLGDKIIFLGCHPESHVGMLLDQAKQQLKPTFFILNTLQWGEALGHWIAIYIHYESQTLAYFDTYNLEPSLHSLTLHHFMQAHSYMTVWKLRYRLQGMQSLVCGIYVMYFCYLLSHHHLKRVMPSIHATFKKGQYFYNDKLITRLGYKLFPMPQCETTFCMLSHAKEFCRREICSVSV